MKNNPKKKIQNDAKVQKLAKKQMKAQKGGNWYEINDDGMGESNPGPEYESRGPAEEGSIFRHGPSGEDGTFIE